MAVEIRLLNGRDQAALLRHVAEGVFDRAVDPLLAAAFLDDRRHYLAVAMEDGIVVGFVSAVRYVHPDKPEQIWINEIGVAPDRHRRGIGARLLKKVLEAGRDAGCEEAWVLTDRANEAAMALYASLDGERKEPDPVMFSWPLRDGPGDV